MKKIAVLLSVLAATVAVAKLRKWNEKMQELSRVVTEMLPDIASSKPMSQKELKRLTTQTKKLLSLAHTINMGPDTKGNPLPPEADPTLSFVSGLFERDVKLAYNALDRGHGDYAKSVLRNVTSHCIACHTRHDRGPDFPSFDLNPRTNAMTPMERAELFTATRHFDKALSEFETIVADVSTASSRQLEWGRAVRHAFSIAIRVRRDPDRALGILQKVEALPKVPSFYREYVAAWKESVLQWKKELHVKRETELELYQDALNLVNAAKGMQKFPLDHSADVLYLRASTVVHELLTRFPGGKYASEALLLAGTAYDLLDDRLATPLPDMYYEACIRQSPRTPVAGKCFRRYEENVYFGWTGSSGTSIPDDVQALLEELRALATPPKSG